MIERLKVGIILNYSTKWMGGIIYILNFIRTMNKLPDSDKPEILLFYNKELVDTPPTNTTDMAELAASGYHDSTRLASGDDEIQISICATNRQSITEWIDRYMDHLAKVRNLVTQKDDNELKEFFKQARETREHWLKNEGRRFLK
jgi:hypothetical protein